ncbi:hypothetical protein BU26DRAFT_548385 [Trematosphaeria pertusa]|uniref:Uncharacterized protein n=1 Tax=Trematosphaeria pertusa TaxID=390896 RepID=A0A6A6IUI3_9PLEO|nr:uncharacterized protein BU26DRAFT_548385 [Trematosphaeria pertusa]KAF2254069.1 hypothetical protein BU26DRAFT_548385 [Trematosphaeria pertusa]
MHPLSPSPWHPSACHSLSRPGINQYSHTRHPPPDYPDYSDYSSDSDRDYDYDSPPEDNASYYNNPTAPTAPTAPPTTMSFLRAPIKLPSSSPATYLSSSSEILILPTLSHITVHLKISSHTATQTLRAAVAGNLRLREIIKQLLGPTVEQYDVRVLVKSRGSWEQPSLETRISDIKEAGYWFSRSGRGDAEIRVECVGRRRGGW